MAERKVFEDSVTPLPDEPGPTPRGLLVQAAEPEHRDAKMTVLFSLEIPPEDEADLEQRVARGEVVPADQLQKRYATDAKEREKLVKWLKAQNFDVTEVSSDGTSVYARASVDQIEKSLGVEMVRVTKDGVTYTAAKNAPSLPADVSKSVHAIIGLQPFRQARKQSRMCMLHNGNLMSLANSAGAAAGKRSRTRGPAKTAKPSAGKQAARVANSPPYLVSEVRKAYGAQELNVTGKGQTIAILIDTVPVASDLKAFWKVNNLPGSISRIEEINVNGGQLPPAEGEETLDVSWASGIAPDAKVRIYASGSLQFVDLDLALDRIIADLPSRPGMRQLSISLGLGEQFFGGPNGEVRTQHAKFLRLAAAGVNVFVSSGDAGSRPDVSGHSASGPTQAEYESSDTSVVSVGGTTLKLTSAGDVASEVGWMGSGGGKSIFFSRPAWQTGAGVPAGGERLVPDVSLAADPNTGAFLVLNGRPVGIGGTSWSAPVWAGFCALINEAREKAGKAFLPFLNPVIYPLIGTQSFRDIQAGTNGDFTAGPGHDLVTGIGVPEVGELTKALTELD
ncbi:S53 family peptidase [Mycobacterium sp.]|uniref:S53 family peptidase n=1 Tax=Mycobacterium sp. TaxID=1785 RepID=UPI002D63FB12|nr:S53 family peptidase [Mycobacterium sp.]HZA10226.1 S53 family peptidase [Mycobacterium sp.]